VLDDIRPLRALATDNTFLQKDIEIFEPPTAYQAAYQQPTGSRFGGDALYNAENRKAGAMITYYLKEGKKKSTDKKEDEEDTKENEKNDKKEELSGVQKKDSIMFQFYEGEMLIRTLKKKTPEKPGFHRIYWNMDEKGPDRPARKISKSKNEPGGSDVKPGTYKIKVTFGTMSDETSIEVKSDPRLEVSTTVINEVYETSKKISALTQTAANAVKQLVESKNVANKFQIELKELDKKKFKDQIKASKDIVKQIDSVIALYIGKEDKRQGITRNPEITVIQRIGTASSYVGSRKTGITQTERRLIQFAEEDLKKALQKTNDLFEDKWKTYREDISKLDISPFKEVKVFDLNKRRVNYKRKS